MRLHIAAIGRLRPRDDEAPLIDDYVRRIEGMAPQLGYRSFQLSEIDEREFTGSPGEMRRKSTQKLLGAVPKGAALLTLDERGKAWSSQDFSQHLAKLRDTGTADACFVIGGADGLDPEQRQTMGRLISLGPATWPHMLVRVMLLEQIYRALTIEAGHPYHRSG